MFKARKGTFTYKKLVNIYITYEINLWPYSQRADFILRNYLFGAVKFAKNVDCDNYSYSGYCIRFDVCGNLSLSDGSRFGKNVIIFGADISSPVQIYNNKKNILILGKGPTDGLDDTTLTSSKEYSIKSIEQQEDFCLSLHYSRVNSYIFVNDLLTKFKTKMFSVDNMKKAGL